MSFNSIEYFIFLSIVLVLYYSINHKRQNQILLLASYLFYGWWDIRFLFLITLSTVIDFVCGFLIRRKSLGIHNLVKANVFLLIATIIFLKLLNIRSNESQLVIAQTFNYGLCILAVFFIFTMIAEKFAKEISSKQRRKTFLTVSILSNLSILCFFKYFNFFIDNLYNLLNIFGIEFVSYRNLEIILPVGISFYTFQTMSYSIDIYRRKIEPTQNILDFALFVSYFPQLVAGPIERAVNLLPAISKKRIIKFDYISRGLTLICWGLFKKIVIADGVSASVGSIYESVGGVSILDIILSTALFSLQIYCDFSGYSDIARGTSKLLGIDLMVNFRLPYFSSNPSEFWKSWHISLSSWLRDYLYIPLGGNRISKLRTYINLMATMTIGGLWHGAGWNYVLWGIYHGTLLCCYRVNPVNFKLKNGKIRSMFIETISILFFFLLVCYGWLLFRANSLDQILNFSLTMVTGFDKLYFTAKTPPLSALCGILILIGFESYWFLQKRIDYIYNPPIFLKTALYGFMIFVFLGSLSNSADQFIYFQF